MTDALDLLTRRNPVDESALPARDGRAVEDLTLIMDGPVPSGRPARRRAGRPLRAALATLGVAGTAALVGGLFLVLPGGADKPKPAGPNDAAWGLEATVRVDATPGSGGLDVTTRRAADVLTARFEAFGVEGVEAEAVAPGAVRLTVPWATLPAQIRGFTDTRDLRLYDLSTTLVATSRNPVRAFTLLTGSPDSPRGPGWYAFARDRLLIGGPFARKERSFFGEDVIWVRPVRGLTLLRADGLLKAPVGERTGIPFLVVKDRPFASGGEITSVGTRGADLEIGFAVDHGGGTEQIAVFGGEAIGVVTSWATGRVLVDMLPGQDTAGYVKALAGGGVGAEMSIETVRPVGAPPPRKGIRIDPLPAIVRRNLVNDILASGRDPLLPGSILRVFSATIDGKRLSVWEGLTRNGGSRFQQLGPDGGGGSSNCALDWTAKIIRRCLWGPASVVGRVAPSVTRVEVRSDGRSEQVPVQNGWFLVASRATKGATIVALDKDGKVLREIPR